MAVTFEKNALVIRIPSNDPKADWTFLLSNLAQTLQKAAWSNLGGDYMCTTSLYDLMVAMILNDETQIKD